MADTSFSIPLLAALLSGTLAIVGAPPLAALAETQGAPPAGEPVLAQAPPPAAQEIPAEVKGWVEEAVAAYQKGDRAKALQLQLQALAWVKAHLGPTHPFRADVVNNLSVLLSAVGRRQEALAPSEEALKIYRELAKTNPAYLPDVAMGLNNLGIRGHPRHLGGHQCVLPPGPAVCPRRMTSALGSV